MKRLLVTGLALMVFTVTPLHADDPVPVKSTITDVILYQNQAEITRSALIELPRGTSTVVFIGLPRDLLDWSARAKLPKDYHGKILSVEVEKKALVSERRKAILDLETALDALREKDQVLVDQLKTVAKQREFLDSIIAFTNAMVKKELTGGLPRVDVWENSMAFTARKMAALLDQKRTLEKDREALGKKIQQLEFELRQIAGSSYYSNFQSLNQALMTNRSKLQVQQYDTTGRSYAERKRFLVEPEGNVEYDKRFNLSVFSATGGKVPVSITYIIRRTSWGMVYDFRADRKAGVIDVIVHGNVFQQTGEDWDGVNLVLSTGSPVGSISEAVIRSWYLSVYEAPVGGLRYEQSPAAAPRMKKAMADESRAKNGSTSQEAKEETIPEAEITKSGSLVEIAIPMKQTVVSSAKFQKKLIREFRLGSESKVAWFYECVPGYAPNAYLKARLVNGTPLPWLDGSAQVFLDKQFTGNSAVTLTMPGSERVMVMNIEPGITTSKKLVKQFEDASGAFGSKRRILYRYQLSVTNRLDEEAEVFLKDTVPVSRNEKIAVEVKNVSEPFIDEKILKNDADFQRGVRTWKMKVKAGEEKIISYEVTVSFDKDLSVNGLR